MIATLKRFEEQIAWAIVALAVALVGVILYNEAVDSPPCVQVPHAATEPGQVPCQTTTTAVTTRHGHVPVESVHWVFPIVDFHEKFLNEVTP